MSSRYLNKTLLNFEKEFQAYQQFYDQQPGSQSFDKRKPSESYSLNRKSIYNIMESPRNSTKISSTDLKSVYGQKLQGQFTKKRVSFAPENNA